MDFMVSCSFEIDHWPSWANFAHASTARLPHCALNPFIDITGSLGLPLPTLCAANQPVLHSGEIYIPAFNQRTSLAKVYILMPRCHTYLSPWVCCTGLLVIRWISHSLGCMSRHWTVMAFLCQYITAETKWLPFCRRGFKMYFAERKLLYF